MPSYNTKLFKNDRFDRITAEEEAYKLFDKISEERSEWRKVKMIETALKKAEERGAEWLGVLRTLEQQ